MNSLKFNKYLKKINTFGDLIDNMEELSVIELDLLKDYIKKMYESVVDDEVKTEKKIKKHKSNKKKQVDVELIEEKEEEKIEFEKPIEELVEVPDNTIVKNVIVEEIKEEFKTGINEEEIKEAEFSNELLELFEVNNSNELSHKLSMSPIKNLTKAFSINERIFTVKELFKGDKSTFEKVIGDIDNLSNLEEAKEYLLNNVVSEFGWDESKMIKKVRQFIVTIKRRFL